MIKSRGKANQSHTSNTGALWSHALVESTPSYKKKYVAPESSRI